MPLNVPAVTVRLPPPGQRMVPVCVLLTALALGGCLVLACLPETTHTGPLAFFQQLFPPLAAALGLLSGALCMFARPASAPVHTPVPAEASVVSGLHALVRQLTDVLNEEHGQIAAFQEIYANSTREALIVSRRLALLADVALDAETRLVAGVAQADAVLRHPALKSGSAPTGAQKGLPEIADLIRRGIADQSRTITATLDAVAARIVTEADGPVQAFRTAVAGATGQIKTLAETATTLGRNVIAFDTAGRGISTASTTVMSRVNDAVARVDEVLAQLPQAAGMVVAAAEQAAETLAAASGMLRADGTAVQRATTIMHHEAESLQAARQDIAQTGAAVLSRINEQVAQADAAVGQLPVAVEAIVAAAEHTQHTVADVSRMLAAETASLAASGQQTQTAANALRLEADTLRAAGQGMSDVGHRTIAAVTQVIETAAARLATVIADADIARQGTTGLAQLAATLESAASTLVDGAYSLDAAGNRIAIEGGKMTERLAADAARNGEMLQALPDVAADMMAAMQALRAETAVLTAAAQNVSAAGNGATAAVTGAAARVEASAASLDSSGRMITATGQQIAARIDHLAEIAGDTETQASLLPAVASDIAAAAARLHTLTEAWRPETMLTILPEAAQRLDAAGPKLDQLHALSERLEHVVAGLEAGQAQEAALATMAVLSADIGEAVRRIEAALTDHEDAWPAVVASMAQIQAATGAATRTAVQERAAPAPDVNTQANVRLFR